MKIYSIGSCRTYGCFNKDQKPDCYFIHSIPEVIQLLTLNVKKLDYKPEFRMININFTNSKRTNNLIEYQSQIQQSDIIVIEISSIKEVYSKEFDLYYNIELFKRVLRKDVDHVKSEKCSILFDKADHIESVTSIKHYNETELFEGLKTIKDLLKGKKIIFIPHINILNDNNQFIPSRNLLCKTLCRFSQQYDNIYYFNPIDYLSNDYSVVFNNDFEHYSISSQIIIKKNTTVGKYFPNYLLTTVYIDISISISNISINMSYTSINISNIPTHV